MILVEKLKCVLHYKKLTIITLCLLFYNKVQGVLCNKTYAIIETSHHIIEQRYFLKQGTVTPEVNILELLCELITTEQKSIKVAAFCLSCRPIAQALGSAAIKNNISVTIVIDPSSLTYTNKFFTKELPLDHPNIHLYIYQMDHQGCMHHKFMLFESTLDNRSLIFEGTLNFSYSALKYNNETVRITENKDEYNAFTKAFEELKTNALHITGTRFFEELFGNKKEGFITTDPLSYCDLSYLNKKRLSMRP